ncbi:amidohydrolase [Candidatus Woesearchaeota archaeon]|nr:amidohydrolase [Candidatus Woesearchaeota archaeon]
MKIIDAHIHTNFEIADSKAFAKKYNIDFSWKGLQNQLNKNNVIAAITISSSEKSQTPGESKELCQQALKEKRLLPVCSVHPNYVSKKYLNATKKLFDEHLIYGIKIFAGYHPVYPSNKKYFPFYKLAAKYDVPVVIHTGDTFGSQYLIKYAHPLDVDEIAVRFPKTKFIIAHSGNPWVRDTAEVVYKNENVYADVSAFCIGHFNKVSKNTLHDIRFALEYSHKPDRFLYGSDWPLVLMNQYIKLIKLAIPEKHHKKVFFENANRIFKLGLN